MALPSPRRRRPSASKTRNDKKKSSPAAMLDADAECFMDFVSDVIAMFPFFSPH
jgi:hypothetical protein